MLVEAKSPTWTIDKDGAWVSFQVPSPQDARRLCEEFQPEKTWELDFHIKRKKRSKDANALMWEICTKIADKLNGTLTKEDVYRKHVREAGAYEILQMPIWAVQRFSDGWEHNGIAWFADVADFVPGTDQTYVQVFAYYGSSSYDTAEMAKLLDSILQDAKAIGVDYLTESDRALLEQYPLGQIV